MNRKGFYSSISALLSVKLLPDYIPESEKLPAASYFHIAETKTQLLSGNISGRADTWRVTVSAKSRQGADDILEQLRLAHNTSDDNFRKIMVISEGDIAATPESKSLTVYMDFKTYG